MAAEITNSVAITTAYTNTDFTRKYKINGLSAETLPNIDAKVEAINASLEGGTAGALSSVFISDDFDSSTDTGYLSRIIKAEIVSTQKETIAW